MDPITRKEKFLAKAGGQSVKTPEPITREEMFLQRIAENGSGGGGGSASIDVTASVGQTIVVEEVDANGKPTKWKAADYQPRTHWTDETVVLPETTTEIASEEGDTIFAIPAEFTLELGKEYTITYNGVDYVTSGSLLDSGLFGFGNLGALVEGLPMSNEPFVLMGQDDEDDEYDVWAVIPFDGAESVTIAITEAKATPIPVEYVSNAFPYYIEVTAETVDTTTTYSCIDTVAEITAIYNSGRSIVARVTDSGYTHYYLTVAQPTEMGMGFGFTTPMFGSYVHRALQFMPQADGAFAITVQEVKS